MSAESLQHLYDKFAVDVTRACAEGRGKALLLSYFEAVAIDRASAAFLAMENHAANVVFMEQAECLAWIGETIEKNGTSIVECVAATMAVFKASPLEIAEAEMVTAVAYSGHLAKLFGSVTVGGSA